VIKPDNAAIRSRPLGPVDPAIFKGELLRRVIAGWQTRDDRGHGPRVNVDRNNARAAVLPAPVRRLVRVGREQPGTLQTMFKADVYRRPCRLKSAASRGLSKRRNRLSSVLAKN